MSDTASPRIELPRSLGLRDMVLFNIVTVVSLRWMATAGAAGPSALTLWVLAALFFFIPSGLAVSDLVARYPQEGGVYAWTRTEFGEWHGFICGWCYWVNNIIYYPQLLVSTAVILTFVFGSGHTGLADQWSYVLPAALIMLWVAVLLNIVGLNTGKWLQNVGAVGTYLPGLALVGLGVCAAFTRPPANPFTLHSLTPDLSKFGELNLWASIAFAFAGLELSATMGDEIREPRRTLPRSIVVAAPLVVFLYTLGTWAVLWLVPQGDINIVSGFLQAISAGAGAATWVAPLAAALYVIGNLGGVGAWIAGPARVAFVIGLDRYFPPAFGRIHPRWKTPYVAILVAAVLASVFLLLPVLGKGSTVEEAYLVLLDMMLLLYFIPFVYLFLAYLRIRFRDRSPAPVAPASRPLALLVGTAGLLLTLFAMVVACVPPTSSSSVLFFELKVVGGALLFVVVGSLVYLRGRRTA